MIIALATLPPAAVLGMALALPASVILLPRLERSLVFGVGLFVLSQPLTSFAINTPVASITADNIVLVLLLALHVVNRPLRHDAGSRLAAGFLLAWAFSYLLRVTYLSPTDMARLLVTTVSFLLIFFVARRLPQSFRTLRVIGLTGFSALTVFGVAALLVTVGVLPRPPVGLTFGRDILGFQSPYPRTYGLNVAIDAIAFLGPITVPLFAYWLVAPKVKLRVRCAAALALSSLVAYILLFFQARGMLLSLAFGIGVMFLITRKYGRWLLLPGGVWAVFEYAPALYASLSGVDTVSSQLRFSNTDILLGMIMDDPASFFFGQNEGVIFYKIAVQLGLAQAIGGVGDDAIHNAFLSQLVGGGWFAFIAFTVPFVMMVFRAFKMLRLNPASPLWSILTVGALLVIFEMMLEPARAQVIGNWMILGLIFAARIPSETALGAESEPRQDALRKLPVAYQRRFSASPDLRIGKDDGAGDGVFPKNVLVPQGLSPKS